MYKEDRTQNYDPGRTWTCWVDDVWSKLQTV